MLGSLRALLDAEEPRLLPPDRALGILSALSDTLFPLHAAGRAQGGIGPDAIEIDGDAVTLGNGADGTPDETFLAPELRKGGEPSPATDAYAFAALAHVLLAGDAPAFEGDGTPLPVAARHPGFPAFAGEAIARGLQKDPAARPLPKVLFTLLRVVPVGRWPASSQPDPEPEAVVVDQPAVADQPAVDRPAVVEHASVVEEVGQHPSRDPEPPVAAPAPAPDDDWHRTFAPVQDVPSIDWSHTADPTRPSDEVPTIAWSNDLAPEAPSAPSALHETDPLTDTREQLAVQVDDATYLHDFIDALRAPSEVPAIEPLDHGIPEAQFEHRPGRRVRRKRREHSPERLQKIVLLLILMALIAVGGVWALTHKDGPKYDPKLQGASLSLSQPAAPRT